LYVSVVVPVLPADTNVLDPGTSTCTSQVTPPPIAELPTETTMFPFERTALGVTLIVPVIVSEPTVEWYVNVPADPNVVTKFVPGACEPELNRFVPVESTTLWLLAPRNSHSTLVGVWFLPVWSAMP
jgi:hypothetical protein